MCFFKRNKCPAHFSFSFHCNNFILNPIYVIDHNHNALGKSFLESESVATDSVLDVTSKMEQLFVHKTFQTVEGIHSSLMELQMVS